MKNISVRGIDDETASRLKTEAARRGTSVNAPVGRLLPKGIGLRPEAPQSHRFHSTTTDYPRKYSWTPPTIPRHSRNSP